MSDLAALREKLETLQLHAKIRRLEAAAAAPGGLLPLREAVGPGSLVNTSEFLTDGVGLSNFGTLNASRSYAQAADKKDGDNYPFWQTEQQWAGIVGGARLVSTLSEVGISALENLTNYTIGKGFGYSFTPAAPGDEHAAKLAAACQAILDEAFESSRWFGHLEREVFTQSRVDGEALVAVRHRGGRNVDLELIDSVSVCEPTAPEDLEDYLGLAPGLNWKYGVATPPGRPSLPQAFFVAHEGDTNDWEVIKACDAVHVKLNVRPAVKRGMSDYLPVQPSLSGGERLLRNTIGGAAVQAAIAYIREHAPGVSREVIDDLVMSLTDETVTEPGNATRGPVERNLHQALPGTVLDVTAGMKYHSGPLGNPSGPMFIDVVQAAWRTAGTRWQMPEYMISGDASNGNYASTLVAEAPFTKATEARQTIYVDAYSEIAWKVIRAAMPACRAFRGITFAQLRRIVSLIVDPPQVAVRNRLEDHQIRREEYDYGILSAETWAAEAGRDLAEQQRMGARPRTPQPLAESFWRGYP